MGETCGLCKIPLATGDCPHALFNGDQITMSRSAWEALVENVNDARTLEANLEDDGYAVVKIGEVPPWMEQMAGTSDDRADGKFYALDRMSGETRP